MGQATCTVFNLLNNITPVIKKIRHSRRLWLSFPQTLGPKSIYSHRHTCPSYIIWGQPTCTVFNFLHNITPIITKIWHSIWICVKRNRMNNNVHQLLFKVAPRWKFLGRFEYWDSFKAERQINVGLTRAAHTHT